MTVVRAGLPFIALVLFIFLALGGWVGYELRPASAIVKEVRSGATGCSFVIVVGGDTWRVSAPKRLVVHCVTLKPGDLVSVERGDDPQRSVFWRETEAEYQGGGS